MRSREIRSGMCVVAALLVVGATAFGRAQQQAPAAPAAGGAAAGQAGGRGTAAPRPPLLSKEKLRFQPEEAPTGGNVFGTGSEPGVYITRNLFRGRTATTPAGGSRPHYHDQDRWVTVIQGTWYTAEGNFYDPDKMIAIKAGGMMYHPAGLVHYDGAREEDVIVQIMGLGPVRTVQAEVDASGKPVTAGGGAGRGGAGAAAPAGRGATPPGTPPAPPQR